MSDSPCSCPAVACPMHGRELANWLRGLSDSVDEGAASDSVLRALVGFRASLDLREAPAGPYTRAQFAAAVDDAHGALHEAEQELAVPSVAGCVNARAGVGRAHAALHRVGAGLPRVDCPTRDPEAQALARELIEPSQAHEDSSPDSDVGVV